MNEPAEKINLSEFLQEMVGLLNQKISKEEASVREMKNEFAGIKSTIRDIERKLTHLAVLENTMGSMRNSIAANDKRMSELSSLRQSVESLEAKTASLESVKDSLSAIEKGTEGAKYSLSLLERRVQDFEGIRDSVKAIEKNLDGAKDSISSLEKRVQDSGGHRLDRSLLSALR